LESDNARPDVEAFRDLENLIRHLGDELASFRRRAIQAEARLRTVDGDGSGMGGLSIDRVSELERQNAEMRARLERATERIRQMSERMRFLRQQQGLVKER
jgi:hypothetical protein